MQLWWIPAHQRIPGNETADRTAKEGIPHGAPSPFALATGDTTAIHKNIIIRKWQQYWKNSLDKCEHVYREIQPTIQLTPWFKGFQASKEAISSIIRLQSSHTSSPSHLFRFRPVDTDQCKCGQGTENPEHSIMHCRLTKNGRDEMMKRREDK